MISSPLRCLLAQLQLILAQHSLQLHLMLAGKCVDCWPERFCLQVATDMAEIELSILSRQCLERRIETKEELQREVKAWQDNRNTQPKTMNWRFDVENARCKLKRLYPSF